MGKDTSRRAAITRDRALAVICVLAILGAFANFWWTSHVVQTSYHRWCGSMGVIATLPLLDTPPHQPSQAAVAREINAVIMHFRERSQQLSCSKTQG